MNLNKINMIGAINPTMSHVGSNPVAKVAVEKPNIVIIIIFFRPILSPKFPKNAPPNGRITNVITYAAKVTSNESASLVDGKNR